MEINESNPNGNSGTDQYINYQRPTVFIIGFYTSARANEQ